MQVIDKIILGTVQLGLKYGINNATGKPSPQVVRGVLRTAYFNGIRVLDTAEAYGDAHHLIGEYHRYNPDTKFKIITKVPKDILNGDIQSKVFNYIDILNVDHIDTLMFHAFLTFKSNPKYLESMISLKERGIINNIGVSIYTNQEFIETIDCEQIDVIQIPFNLFDNWSLRGNLIEEAKRRGKIIHTRSAFLQGLFFKDPQSEDKITKSLRDELLLINDIADKEHKTLSSLSLNYCLQNSCIDNVLIGVDTIQQLENNLSIIGQELSDDAIQNINNINIQDLKLLNPSLWN